MKWSSVHPYVCSCYGCPTVPLHVMSGSVLNAPVFHFMLRQIWICDGWPTVPVHCVSCVISRLQCPILSTQWDIVTNYNLLEFWVTTTLLILAPAKGMEAALWPPVICSTPPMFPLPNINTVKSMERAPKILKGLQIFCKYFTEEAAAAEEAEPLWF